MSNWKILKKGFAFKSKWRSITKLSVRTPQGQVRDYFVSNSPDAIVIFGLTSDKKVILIDQHVIKDNARALMLSAGFLDDGEAPLKCAKREFLEETGYVAKKWINLGRVSIGKWTNGSARYFLALDAVLKSNQVLEDSEDIVVKLTSLTDFMRLLRVGKLYDNYALCGSLLALDWLRSHRKV